MPECQTAKARGSAYPGAARLPVPGPGERQDPGVGICGALGARGQRASGTAVRVPAGEPGSGEGQAQAQRAEDPAGSGGDKAQVELHAAAESTEALQ